MGYEQYLRSADQTEETEATKGQALKDKEKQNKILAILLGKKGFDLIAELRNESIRSMMTGKDVYTDASGAPISLGRGVEKPSKGFLDTLRRSFYLKPSDFTPMDYSDVTGYTKQMASVQPPSAINNAFAGLLGGVGSVGSIVQGLSGMDTTGQRSAGEADKQKLSSAVDVALAASTLTPLAPVTGPLALGKSLLSWIT